MRKMELLALYDFEERNEVEVGPVGYIVGSNESDFCPRSLIGKIVEVAWPKKNNKCMHALIHHSNFFPCRHA